MSSPEKAPVFEVDSSIVVFGDRISLGTDLCTVRNRCLCTLFVMEWKITFAIARMAPLVGKQILLQRARMHLRQCRGDSPNNGSLERTGRY